MTFEFQCGCGRRFEIDAPIGKAPSTKKCPDCGKRARRAYSAPAVRFKGTGFHVNDYGPGSPKDDG
jgi:putative FmdB family regulatory protein